MATIKISKRAVDALHYQGNGHNPSRFNDSALRGFNVRVYPSGRKLYGVRYRVDGRRREASIGYHGEITAEQARKAATKLIGQAAQGCDPLVEREEQRATVATLAAAYMDRHAKPHKKSWKKDEARIERYVLPSIGSLPVRSVRRPDVERMHHNIGVKRGKRTEANRVLALVSIMFSKAIDWGLLPPGSPNPCARISKFGEEARQRYLSPEEMGRLMVAIAEEDDPFIRGYFHLLVLLGVRKMELLHAKWMDVDMDRGVLRLPETKSGKPQSVPLPEAAVNILLELPRTLGNDYVFSSPVKFGAPREGMQKPWRRIRQKAGLSDVRLHDIRRTLGAWAVADGDSLRVVQGVLRHSSPTVTAAHYAPFDQNTTLRAAMERHSSRVARATADASELALPNRTGCVRWGLEPQVSP